MAGTYSAQVSGISVASTTVGVLGLLAAATRTVRILEVSFSLEESDPSADSPFVKLQRVTSGTMTGTAVTAAECDTEDIAFDSTVKHTTSGLTYNDTSGIIAGEYVAKGWTYRPPTALILRPGEQIGLRCTIAAATITVSARIIWQEI